MSQDANNTKIKDSYLQKDLNESNNIKDNILFSEDISKDIDIIKQEVKKNSSSLERIQSDIEDIKKFQFEKLENLFNGIYALCESFKVLDDVLDELKLNLHL